MGINSLRVAFFMVTTMFYTSRPARRLPKQSRRIPLRGNKFRGDGEDSGKWFRCWHCGWICNQERDTLGDSQSTSAVTITEEIQIAADSGRGAVFVLGDSIQDYQVAMEYGADGSTAKGIRYSFEPDVSGGCPFCGSTNWRGDY